MRAASLWGWFRGRSPLARVSLTAALILVAALVAAIIFAPRFAGQPSVNCDSPATLARIHGPNTVDTAYEVRIRKVLACVMVARSLTLGFTDHSSPTGEGMYIAVYVWLGPQPDAASERQTIFTDAFAVQRALWQSDLKPIGVGIQFYGTTYFGADCSLSASRAAHVNWAAETPENAWRALYTPVNLTPVR